MAIGGQKEEPPDEGKSGESEISQEGKEEWHPPIDNAQKQEIKFELGQTDLRFGQENENESSLSWAKLDRYPDMGMEAGIAMVVKKDYCPHPKRMSQLFGVKYELGQTEHLFGFGKNENVNKPKVLVIDEKHGKLEQNIPESPITPDFVDCNSTMGTPLVSPSKYSQKVPVFFIGGGKPIFTQSPSDKEGQSPSDIENQIPLPLNIGNLSYIGNTENTDLIIHSNIVIKETENIIVEFDDRMEQPLGLYEVVKAAEEGDTVLSQSTETSANNT
ncbi:hypothetical protein JTB14_019868 [Gonioctena quinquepunctata]|nr:hypothetical protein JTB14_019868 [Gonioctena quinquepunctata]